MPTYQRAKDLVFDLLDGRPSHSKLDRLVYVALLVLIVVTTAALVTESIPVVKSQPQWHGALNRVERFSLWIFAVEYVLRVWSCPATLGGTRFGRWRLLRHPLMLIDLLALLPLYGPWLSIDIRRHPILRSVRVLRMLKLAQYLPGMHIVWKVIRSRVRELTASLGLVLLVLLCASTVLYFCEATAQPDKFTSIPSAMWWGIATITTTGYGDIYPITAVGKLLGGAFAMLGVLTFALPTAILGSAFLEEWQRHDETHR